MKALIVSAGLDTNGQNARYVQAARKHGTERAVLRAFAIGRDDPAGVVARFAFAAKKHGGLEIREAHKARNYLDFPRDIVWDRNSAVLVRGLAESADVLHLNNSYRAYNMLRCDRPALLHHHGSLFRKDPAHMLAMAKSYHMAQAVSTIDLAKPDPKVLHWLPTAYDLDALMAIRQANRREDDGRIRLVSAPTNRAYKATVELVAAVKSLQREGLPLDLVLVEGVTNAECLIEKAKADIVFDQIAFGYGCNAVEAWGMGVPVIAGAEDPWVTDRMRSEWGDLPYYEATKATIADAIRALVVSADLRAEWAERGHAHAERFHAEIPALVRLAELYALAIRMHVARDIEPVPVDSVTFANEGYHSWYTLDGQRLSFPVSLTNPVEIGRLRTLARSRPLYGIREIEA